MLCGYMCVLHMPGGPASGALIPGILKGGCLPWNVGAKTPCTNLYLAETRNLPCGHGGPHPTYRCPVFTSHPSLESVPPHSDAHVIVGNLALHFSSNIMLVSPTTPSLQGAETRPEEGSEAVAGWGPLGLGVVRMSGREECPCRAPTVSTGSVLVGS